MPTPKSKVVRRRVVTGKRPRKSKARPELARARAELRLAKAALRLAERNVLKARKASK